MLTRRIFLRGSAVVMAGMGAVPSWLARAASVEGKKRKILVAIFQRGAADGLNIVVPFSEKRYRELRPTLAIAPPTGTATERPMSMVRSTARDRSGRALRVERRDAAAEGSVGQTATGDCRSHRLARFVALALRRAGLHGIGHVRQDHGQTDG